MPRAAWLAALSATAACNAVSGVGDLHFGAIGGGGSAGSASSASGTSAVGGGGGSTGAGLGGQGGIGGRPFSCDAPAFGDPTTGHCYLAPGAVGSWSKLRTVCQDWGGDLAALSSESEFVFVVEAIPGTNHWLGGSDDDGDGTYVWSNGERWGANNWALEPGKYPWAQGQPNLGNPVCLQVKLGAFDSEQCDNGNSGLCERLPEGM